MGSIPTNVALPYIVPQRKEDFPLLPFRSTARTDASEESNDGSNPSRATTRNVAPTIENC